MCHHWRNKVNLNLTGIVLINVAGIGKLVFLLYDRRQLDVISLFLHLLDVGKIHCEGEIR